MLDFSEENMCMWTMDYVNLNNNIYINIYEAREDLIQVEK